MKTSNRRITLLAGVSVAALGLTTVVSPTAALAAPHDGLADGFYPGFSTSTATIELCDLATPPGSPCFFGEIDTVNPATATVPAFFLSQFDTAPTVALSMVNNGSAEIGAIAIATGVAGNATATADVGFDVLFQSALATAPGGNPRGW